MSARNPVGASNRSELFTSRESKQPESSASLAKDQYISDDSDNNNPLQLEHMLGYSGDYKRTVVTSQYDENIYYKG